MSRILWNMSLTVKLSAAPIEVPSTVRPPDSEGTGAVEPVPLLYREVLYPNGTQPPVPQIRAPHYPAPGLSLVWGQVLASNISSPKVPPQLHTCSGRGWGQGFPSEGEGDRGRSFSNAGA